MTLDFGVTGTQLESLDAPTLTENTLSDEAQNPAPGSRRLLPETDQTSSVGRALADE